MMTRLDPTVPVVDAVDLTKIFPGPPAVNALRGVDLRIAHNDYLAIVGPSGSGKSTILNMLGLLDRPTSGALRFGGVATETMSEDARAALRSEHIGFVFQAFHLLSRRTVLENVMLAAMYAPVPRAEREERARAALDRVGLSHRVSFTPATLSGGERQRVAIARAVCTSPGLLLADEPTGNLDRNSSDSVMELFEELNADGIAIVIITHDDDVAQRAARRIRISDGTLQELT
ncbi:ABC transporter ATP-binding protein [Leucobacter luti]|uniref:Putative ABC transport system ATP-binding protein n=1 Tax=Leucobacter luti TaxID=340320 RepID=A0A4Q7TS46_9MICO|nr:ABC transporter ATP-binding protein [Leucobacter luti]MBL3699751.1 ABC transporter ATP-binding protein [Leucobacter luti]RZT62927.1 putative ABC transport system ATP-binding protein [Leucobacter luti]